MEILVFIGALVLFWALCVAVCIDRQYRMKPPQPTLRYRRFMTEHERAEDYETRQRVK